jgi:hypothetical protein
MYASGPPVARGPMALYDARTLDRVAPDTEYAYRTSEPIAMLVAAGVYLCIDAFIGMLRP